MDFTEITIDDKQLFDKYFKLYNPQISELTFTNIFMWRNFYNFRYTEFNSLLIIVAAPANALPFAYMPIGKVDKYAFEETVSTLKSYFQKNSWKLEFRRVEESELNFFGGLGIPEENYIFDHNNSDYVYLSVDLIGLKGKKYDGKRNHINRFKKEYRFEYVPINEDLMDECKRIMKNWCKERSCEHHKDLYCEKIANFELLNNFNSLGCTGALLKVDDVYRAFTVGEMLNNDTAVIHIEKADSKINGLYTLVNQQFCENEFEKAIYINREQDLGVEGLRKAKLSYNPVKMIKKFTVKVG